MADLKGVSGGLAAQGGNRVDLGGRTCKREANGRKPKATLWGSVPVASAHGQPTGTGSPAARLPAGSSGGITFSDAPPPLCAAGLLSSRRPMHHIRAHYTHYSLRCSWEFEGLRAAAVMLPAAHNPQLKRRHVYQMLSSFVIELWEFDWEVCRAKVTTQRPQRGESVGKEYTVALRARQDDLILADAIWVILPQWLRTCLWGWCRCLSWVARVNRRRSRPHAFRARARF